MNSSQKKTHLLINLLSINYLLVMVAYIMMIPRIDSWKESIVFLALIVISGLSMGVANKLFLPILIDSYSPKYDTKIKNQLWGLFLRILSGAIGLVVFIVIASFSSTIIFVTTGFYLIVLCLGFINDGKTFDKYHEKLTINN